MEQWTTCYEKGIARALGVLTKLYKFFQLNLPILYMPTKTAYQNQSIHYFK